LMDSQLLIGSAVALALILLPEPVTTASGTLLGMGILAGLFAVEGGIA